MVLLMITCNYGDDVGNLTRGLWETTTDVDTTPHRHIWPARFALALSGLQPLVLLLHQGQVNQQSEHGSQAVKHSRTSEPYSCLLVFNACLGRLHSIYTFPDPKPISHFTVHIKCKT